MKRAVLPQAGIIDQNVYLQVLSRVIDILRRSGVIQIRDNDAHLGSFGCQLGGQRLQPILSAGREDEFGALPRQLPRQFRANARTGPGDQCPSAVKIFCVCHCGSIIADGQQW